MNMKTVVIGMVCAILGVMVGITLGLASFANLIELGKEAKRAVVKCEESLPRNQVCFVVARPFEALR